LTHLWVGAAVLPFSSGFFYPARLLQAIAEYHITGVAANPTTFRILTAAQRDHVPLMDQVRYVMTGGQPLEQGVVQQIARYFPHARIGNMYGCTENSPRICFSWLPPDALARWLCDDLKVVDTTGHHVSPGLVGEILITSTSLMRCYWREPNLTDRYLVDGWFQTGDLGFLAEDGALSLVGRRDNLINVGHEKVAPEEVEIVIACVLGVVEVGVAPGEDALLGCAGCDRSGT
jgi:acyl-coenzyme A synthetase/AMP-(fatty) acid ligase